MRDGLAVSVTSTSASARTLITAQANVDDLTTAFTPEHLKPLLGCFGGPVNIDLSAGARPALLTEASSAFRAVLVPVRLADLSKQG
jgi:hypothetical protein